MSDHAAAKGGMDGGGGDPHCAEYANIAGKISVALARVGQENINKINPLVDARSFWEVKKQMRCVPTESLDRVARSYRPSVKGQPYTELLVSEWAKLSFIAKARLATHELAVMAGYENDGEYFVSEPLFNEIAKHVDDFKSPFGGEQIYNKDGSVTFVNPTFQGRRVYAAWTDTAMGACRFAGFKDAASKNGTERIMSGDGREPVAFSESGHSRGPIMLRGYLYVFTALTCLTQ